MVGSLVRYGKRRFTPAGMIAMRYAPAYKKARVAYGAASYLYHNRKRVGMAANTIRRAYRRYRRSRQKFSRTHIGGPVGYGTAKKRETVRETQMIVQTRTLYRHELNTLPRDLGSIDNSSRFRDIVNVRGWKICMEIANTASIPIYLNVAVLSSKQQQIGENANGDNFEPDFFRDEGQRGVDFVDPNLSSIDYHCRPINSDKFVILKHKRYRLANDTGSNYQSGASNSYKNINWWIPCRRQIRYEDGKETPETGEVKLVYWTDRFLSGVQQLPSTTAQLNLRCITYFKEPKN